MSDGLANNTVRSIYQDNKGFMWFVSLNGLSRFDGSQFVNYQHEAGRPSLPDGGIRGIDDDGRGHLWISSDSEHMSCFDLRLGQFVDYTGSGEYDLLYGGLLFASNGDVWLWHSQGGARRVRPTGDGFVSLAFTVENGNLSANDVYRVAEDEQGRIWISSRHALHLVRDDAAEEVMAMAAPYSLFSHLGNYFVSSDGRQIVSYERGGMRSTRLSLSAERVNVTGTMPLGDDFVIFTNVGGFRFSPTHGTVDRAGELDIRNGEVTQDNRGHYWISNHTGILTQVNSENGQVKHIRLISEEKMRYVDNERYHVVHDSRDLEWISTYGNGLFVYDTKSDELQHFSAAVNGYGQIPSDYLLSIAEDHAGGIWVGAEFSGIAHLKVINEGATYIYPAGKGTTDDRANMIRLLSILDEDQICIGTRHGGVYVYDMQLNLRSTKQFRSNIYTAQHDGAGHLWLGSRGDGICIDGIEDKWHRHDSSDSTSLSGDNIFDIHRDRRGRMWIAVFHGGLDVAYRDKDGECRFRHFFTDSYALKQARAIAEDHNGYLWLGTSDGVVVFNPDSLLRDPSKYSRYNTRNSTLPGNEIKSFCVDRKGRVWLATARTGLAVCENVGDYDNLQFRTYNVSHGLVSDMVQAVVEDHSGRIWASTEFGISCLDLRSQVFENHFFSSFIPGNTFSDNSACVAPDGRLLFGSIYGFVVVDPDQLGFHDSQYVPQVCLTGLRINGLLQTSTTEDSPLTTDIAYTTAISLEHQQNNIEVSFSTFDFPSGGSVKYSYCLEPYSSEWSTPSAQNSATYKNLPPGDYTLKIKACNAMGVWGERVTQLAVHVEPPLWESTWAYLLYVAVILAIIIVLMRMLRKINSLHNSITVEKQLTDYKLVFFTNISHEFRTPLTLIQGALEKLEDCQLPRDAASSVKTIGKSTHRLLRLINQLLEFRKMQNNKMSLALEEVDVVAFLRNIFQTFEESAESKSMTYRFETSADEFRTFIDRGNLDKVVYNLLSNAFKYPPAGGTVRLVFAADDAKKQMTVSVIDTGVGISSEQRGKLFERYVHGNVGTDSIGIGLNLTSELVRVHHGEISYQPNDGGGSIFTIELPTDKSVYAEEDFVSVNDLAIENEAIERRLINEENEIVEDEPTDEAKPLNKQHILIIEDDDDVREFLRKELGFYFDVATAADGRAGLDYAQKNDLDLIVCDVMMPRMSGLEVTETLKKNIETCHIPIILLTALSSEEQQIEGFKSGADAYVTKPFSPRILLTRIVKLIEQRSRLREKFTNSLFTEPTVLSRSSQDKAFAERLQQITEENMANPQLSVDDLASHMNMGRTIFYRKVKGVIGYSPNEYLRIMRLKKGAELLITTSDSIAEISYQIGFNDPFYFSKCFKQQFGVTPSAYQKGKGEA